MLYLQLAKHQAPLQRHGRILSSAGCYGSSTTQHSEGLRAAGGTIHHLIETYQCFFVNLYHVQFHWDWVVIYPLLSANHKDYDFCFLWGCTGRRDLVHLDPFPSEFYWLHALRFFCMWQDNFSLHVFPCFPAGGKRRKYGWDGHPLVQPSQQFLKSSPGQQTGNPGMRPAHASPGRLLQLQCCSLSVQEGPNTSWCIVTVIRHFSAHCRGQIWKGTKAS